jgi:two-component system response regulator FixJ
VPPDPTVCIVDDDEAVRDSLAALLEAEGLQVATFSSARAFLEADIPSTATCLVTDVRMPDMDGLQLLGVLATRPSPPPVIVITGHGDVPMAVRAMKLGAADFIEKPFKPDALLGSVRNVLRAPPAHAAAQCAQVAERLDRLTAREREVLELLVVGRPNKVIALELGISPRTVEIHRARVMEKMEAESLSHLVRMALSAGIDPAQS